MINVLKELCKLHAGSYGIERTSSVPRFQSKRPPRGHSFGDFDGPSAAKFPRGGYNRGFGGRGGYGGPQGGYGGFGSQFSRGRGFFGRGGFRGRGNY